MTHDDEHRERPGAVVHGRADPDAGPLPRRDERAHRRRSRDVRSPASLRGWAASMPASGWQLRVTVLVVAAGRLRRSHPASRGGCRRLAVAGVPTWRAAVSAAGRRGGPSGRVRPRSAITSARAVEALTTSTSRSGSATVRWDEFDISSAASLVGAARVELGLAIRRARDAWRQDGGTARPAIPARICSALSSEGQQLTLTRVSDACPERAAVLAGDWVRTGIGGLSARPTRRRGYSGRSAAARAGSLPYTVPAGWAEIRMSCATCLVLGEAGRLPAMPRSPCPPGCVRVRPGTSLRRAQRIDVAGTPDAIAAVAGEPGGHRRDEPGLGQCRRPQRDHARPRRSTPGWTCAGAPLRRRPAGPGDARPDIQRSRFAAELQRRRPASSEGRHPRSRRRDGSCSSHIEAQDATTFDAFVRDGDADHRDLRVHEVMAMRPARLILGRCIAALFASCGGSASTTRPAPAQVVTSPPSPASLQSPTVPGAASASIDASDPDARFTVCIARHRPRIAGCRRCRRAGATSSATADASMSASGMPSRSHRLSNVGFRGRRVSCTSRSTRPRRAVHGRSSSWSRAATSRPVSPGTTSTRWRRRWPGEARWSWWASGGRAANGPVGRPTRSRT